MTLEEITRAGIDPALAMLPGFMDTPRARVMLCAIGLQESRFEHRRQMGNGPARGFWQFEQGGGVRGCINHPASAPHLRKLCEVRDVAFDARAVWVRIETDDVLAAGLARLLLITDPRPLPGVGDAAGAWDCYYRNWRPGQPHRDTWDVLHMQAMLWVLSAKAGA